MKTPRPEYWNHNTAYYPWIRKRVSGCGSVLDAGCGDGSLAFYLGRSVGHTVGIDVDEKCVGRAAASAGGRNTDFICGDFEEYDPRRFFDAVVFSASIHHMDMPRALKRAKALLAPGGKLLIVGLAKPSTAADLLLEAARVLPSKALSALHHICPSEELRIPVSYEFPPMDEVRGVIRTELPDAKLRYGLHYRYLLEWTRPDSE